MESSRWRSQHEVPSLNWSHLNTRELTLPVWKGFQTASPDASNRRLSNHLVTVLQRAIAWSHLHLLGMVLCRHEVDAWTPAWTLEWWFNRWLHPQTHRWRPSVEMPARIFLVEILRQWVGWVDLWCFTVRVVTNDFSFTLVDTSTGGITIAWVNEGNDGNPCVLHIQPFTAKDFSTRSLSDRIRDFDDLTILFPNKAKNEAFDKYTTPTGLPKNKDYIPSEIRAILPLSNPNLSMSYAATPNSQFMQSPDPSRDTPSVHSGWVSCCQLPQPTLMTSPLILLTPRFFSWFNIHDNLPFCKYFCR